MKERIRDPPRKKARLQKKIHAETQRRGGFEFGLADVVFSGEADTCNAAEGDAKKKSENCLRVSA
jgi:hypothetical protein